MAGYFLYPVDWSALETYLEAPATTLAEVIAKDARQVSERWRLSTFPADSKDYAEALAAFLSSPDWYDGLNKEDREQVDGLAESLIVGYGLSKKLNLIVPLDHTDIDDLYESIYWDCIEVLWSGAVLPASKRTAKDLAWSDFLCDQDNFTPAVPSFGHAPFRHPTFDYRATQKERLRLTRLDLKNDTNESSTIHLPMYGLHPPESVARMRAMVEEAAPRMGGLTAYCRGEFDYLRHVLAKTVAVQGGLLVSIDY